MLVLNCRFIAVTQPIKYARHKNHKRVWLTIGLVWAISAAIGSPIVLGLNHTPSRDPTLCIFYNFDFVIYSSLSSFYIPCIIMVFLYYRIFKVSQTLFLKVIYVYLDGISISFRFPIQVLCFNFLMSLIDSEDYSNFYRQLFFFTLPDSCHTALILTRIIFHTIGSE